MKIGTKDLRKIFNILIDHLEATDQGVTDLPWDFYWETSKECHYNPHGEPRELSLGQLSDDWEDLLKIVNGDMPPVGYAFK